MSLMSPTVAGIAGVVGVVVALLAALVPALAYQGYQKERFDPRNHFISELGEVGISRAARVFNAGLILTGLVLIPFMVGAAVYTAHWLGYVAGVVGVVTTLAVAAVGVFPMNKLSSHSIAALTFFNAGQVTSLLFSLCVIFIPTARLPLWLLIPTGLSTLAFVAFLRTPFTADNAEAFTKDRQAFVRPRWWLSPTLEWSVYFTVLAWIFCLALVLLQ